MGSRLTTNRYMQRLSALAAKQFFNDYAYYTAPASPDSPNLDSRGQPITTSEEGYEFAFRCSFVDATAEARKWLDDIDVHHVDVLVRFEKGDFIPEKGGRIKPVGRFNAIGNMEEEVYEIVNIRDRDLFGWVCGLRRASV